MIHVLIVDDDKLVRKGLMSFLPWESFGMRVVGEAANGEKALDFLKTNRVDLLMTDLAMPVMSGIELIRVVRKLYPNIAIAVLTLHQDFEYIQEALRLGAIDYIAKVELEKEQFEEVFQRIHSRIVAEKQKHKNEAESIVEACSSETAYALLTYPDELLTSRMVADCVSLGWIAETEGSILMWLTDLAKEVQPQGHYEENALPPLPNGMGSTGWRLVRLRHTAGLSPSELLQRIRAYRRRDFFYDCDGHEPYPIEKSVMELLVEHPEPGEEESDTVKELLHAFTWVHDDVAFEKLCSRLKELRIPVTKLMQWIYGCMVDWNRLYRTIQPDEIKMPDIFTCWREVEDWLKQFREHWLTRSGSLQLSPEVSGSIMTAVKIVHDELELPLFAIDVAKRVNLSRSYFYQCFKEIVGYSFNEYLRKVRIDKAREYLEQTSRPIVWIAKQTGYEDEKYFSRTFREQTGMLPSEYRQQYRANGRG
ncbi:DNA-binding response regulator [Paenibacillus ihbetae]|uniref:DNA-binding response regulator n=1 Tax=Paenibacillus ihbetae TaxID=1870820 RepID=A0A1B2DU83_9BACL|nr:helix-turn-helix domain-containing protein [Paenibacillus ihbetae]ANY71273.1 DNA-binding response regulator [Paenibacillus ihbetae]